MPKSSKTDAQIAADKLMREAFEACTRAYDETDMGAGIVVDAMAIVVTTQFDEAGEAWHTTGLYYGGNNTPRYRITGLLDEAVRKLDECTCEDFDDE